MSPPHRRIALGALEQSVPRAPYWLAVLLPLCVAGGYLYVSRRK